MHLSSVFILPPLLFLFDSGNNQTFSAAASFCYMLVRLQFTASKVILCHIVSVNFHSRVGLNVVLFYQTAKILYWRMGSITLSTLLQWPKRLEQSFISVLFRSSFSLLLFSSYQKRHTGSDSNYVDIASRQNFMSTSNMLNHSWCHHLYYHRLAETDSSPCLNSLFHCEVRSGQSNNHNNSIGADTKCLSLCVFLYILTATLNKGYKTNKPAFSVKFLYSETEPAVKCWFTK